MQRLIDHEPADLVATAEAGITLETFNQLLGRGGQWLPLDPPDDGRATLGGVVATGLSGSQLCGFGSPRSFVIGMKVVLPNGRTSKAGGRVVKNVAGYDLCKLFSRSYGTLGVICELTFKLRPRPAKETTLRARGSLRTMFAAAWSVYKGALFPVALELLSANLETSSPAVGSPDDAELLIRFAGIKNTVAYQIGSATQLLKDNGLRDIETVESDESVWRNVQMAPIKSTRPLAYRISVKPSEVLSIIEKVSEHSDNESAWHSGVADGRVRVMQSKVDTQKLIRLREITETLGGSLVIENVPAEIKNAIDAWGSLPAPALMNRIKQQLDPAELFSPGRF
jgi:FAD/FMN-containing dehydrogenase